jgi:SSS family solute:Na+ symporter
MFNLSPIDIAIVIAYITGVLLIGFRRSRKAEASKDREHYLLAGRKLTVPFFVATLVATWYGNILGVGEFVYNNGLVAWLCFGITYYITAIIYAFYFAGRIRKLNIYSIPEQIKNRYGLTSSIISSFIVLIITVPAAYILMTGYLLHLFTGWNLTICVIGGALVSVVYLQSGGFDSDVKTNTFQFVLMYVGFGVLLVFAVLQYGSPLKLFSELPANHTKLFGGLSWQYIFSWFLIACQTFIDPSFHQRCSAAETPATAKKGILISVGFWLIFDILTLLTGLYARAHFQISDGAMAYPVLSEAILPVFWKGLFVVAMLATIMSTLVSYSFLSASTIGNDILAKIINRKQNRISSYALTNYGLIITMILGIILALALPSPVELIYRAASIAVPGLIMPLLLSFSSKNYLSNKTSIALMIISVSSAGLWYIGRFAGIHAIFNDFEPMVVGIVVSLLLSLIIILRSQIKGTI